MAPQSLMAPLQLEIFNWTIWSNLVLNIDLPAHVNSNTIHKTVQYTSLNSATLNVDINAVCWPSWGHITLNGVKIQDIDFRFGSGVISYTLDVAGLLIPGKNTFVIVMQKQSWVGWGPWTITATLTVDGTNVDIQDDWWANAWEWIKQNPLVILGVAMGVMGVTIFVWKKKKG